jgi:hypothetical protein
VPTRLQLPNRLIVLQPAARADVAPALQVGVARWQAGGPRLTVAVKLTIDRHGMPAYQQRPLRQPEGDDPGDFAARSDGVEARVVATGERVPLHGRALGPGAQLELGVIVPGSSAVTLPALEPQLVFTNAELDAHEVVPLRCDTVWIDGESLELCWRAEHAQSVLGRRGFDRLVVSLEEPGSSRTLAERLGDRPELSFAIEPGVEAGPTDAEELRLERWSMMEQAPAPRLTVAQYAAIAADLAEGDTTRGEVLSSHGLDEESWMLEERGWLERMAEAAMRGDATIAVAYGDAFVAAQDSRGDRAELDAMIHEFVAVTVGLERTADPGAVLARWALSLAEWLRLDRHWQRRAAEEPAVRAQLEQLIADERSRSGEEVEEP